MSNILPLYAAIGLANGNIEVWDTTVEQCPFRSRARHALYDGRHVHVPKHNAAGIAYKRDYVSGASVVSALVNYCVKNSVKANIDNRVSVVHRPTLDVPFHAELGTQQCVGLDYDRHHIDVGIWGTGDWRLRIPYYHYRSQFRVPRSVGTVPVCGNAVVHDHGHHWWAERSGDWRISVEELATEFKIDLVVSLRGMTHLGFWYPDQPLYRELYVHTWNEYCGWTEAVNLVGKLAVQYSGEATTNVHRTWIEPCTQHIQQVLARATETVVYNLQELICA